MSLDLPQGFLGLAVVGVFVCMVGLSFSIGRYVGYLEGRRR